MAFSSFRNSKLSRLDSELKAITKTRIEKLFSVRKWIKFWWQEQPVQSLEKTKSKSKSKLLTFYGHKCNSLLQAVKIFYRKNWWGSNRNYRPKVATTSGRKNYMRPRPNLELPNKTKAKNNHTKTNLLGVSVLIVNYLCKALFDRSHILGKSLVLCMIDFLFFSKSQQNKTFPKR